MNQVVNENKIWVDKGTNFIIDPWNHGCKMFLQKTMFQIGQKKVL